MVLEASLEKLMSKNKYTGPLNIMIPLIRQEMKAKVRIVLGRG